MTIPTDASVNTSFPNTAAVRSYETATNRPGVTAEHLPRSNIDTSTDPRDWDVPRASDDSEVHTPSVSLDKSNLTDITEPNNGPNQAVVGETLTYTAPAARAGAHRGLQRRAHRPDAHRESPTSPRARRSRRTNTSPATDPLPAGFTLDPANGTLRFPASYINNDDNPHLFEVRIRARISTLASNAQGSSASTPPRFDSQSAPVLGTDLPTVTARSTVTVVDSPDHADQERRRPRQVVEAGQVVTYTPAAGRDRRPPAGPRPVGRRLRAERPDVRRVPRPAPRYGDHGRRDGKQRVCRRDHPDRLEPARQLDDRAAPPLHRDGLAARRPAASATPTPRPPRAARSTTARPTRWLPTTRSNGW